MIKRSTHQENITIAKIYASNIGAPKYIKQKLLELKGEINSNIVIVEDFNAMLSTIHRSSRQNQ